MLFRGLRRYLGYGLLGLAIVVAATGVPRHASASAETCEIAASQISVETGVPLEVLRAISLTETGRNRGGRIASWPWTVNMEGRGEWFDTAREALDFANDHHRRGARSFDVGCFQLNYRWHGENFASVEAMFDPVANARYAARFLRDLYDEFNDWSLAAGAYHSRTEIHASKYRTRFDKFMTAQAGQDWEPELRAGRANEAQTIARVNRYPLLQTGSAPRAIGSLVPQTGSASPFLLARASALR